jgi:hypothetical protein
VGQIAASPAAHQDLNAGFVVLFEDDDTVIATGRAQPPSRDSTGHQSGGTSPDHRDVHADASNEQVPKSDVQNLLCRISLAQSPHPKPPEGGIRRGPLFAKPRRPTEPITQNVLLA